MGKEFSGYPKPKLADQIVKERCSNLDSLSISTGICKSKLKTVLSGETRLDYKTACLIAYFFRMTPDELFYDDYFYQLDLKTMKQQN